MSFFRISLLGLLYACADCSIARATITITSHELYVAVSDDSEYFDIKQYRGLSIPTNPDPVQLDVMKGETLSKNTIRWSTNGGQTIFSFDTNQTRSGNAGSMTFNWGFETWIRFRANEKTTYELSGHFDVTEFGPGAGTVVLGADLYDEGTGTYIFAADQWSQNTHNERFILGELDADSLNFLLPGSSLRGPLIAGHYYQFKPHSYIYTNEPDAGASAVGNFTLKIGTVPEPASLLLLFALGLVSLRCRRIERPEV